MTGHVSDRQQSQLKFSRWSRYRQRSGRPAAQGPPAPGWTPWPFSVVVWTAVIYYRAFADESKTVWRERKRRSAVDSLSTWHVTDGHACGVCRWLTGFIALWRRRIKLNGFWSASFRSTSNCASGSSSRRSSKYHRRQRWKLLEKLHLALSLRCLPKE